MPTHHAHTTPMCRTTHPTIRELLRLKLTFLQNIPSNLQRYVMYSHTLTFYIYHIMWLTDSSLLEFHSQREIMGYLARLTTLANMALLPVFIICSTEKLWVTPSSRYTPSLLYHSHAPRSHSRLGSTIPTLMRRVRCAYLSSAPRIGNLPPKLTKVVTSTMCKTVVKVPHSCMHFSFLHCTILHFLYKCTYLTFTNIPTPHSNPGISSTSTWSWAGAPSEGWFSRGVHKRSQEVWEERRRIY